ncbi:MAG: glycosyltransferase [Microgenomates group bacterium]
MKISVDYGAVESKKYFGTKIFAQNLKEALIRYDNKNTYIFYDFKNVYPKIFWNKIGLSIAELKFQPKIFLALNQAVPLYVNGKIISFFHGLSFYFYPEFYSKSEINRLNSQLKEMVKRSDKIVVSSIRVKKELLKLFLNKNIDKKIFVLPFGVPFDILKNKPKKNKEKIFLFVGGSQPIKNFSFIKNVFKEFQKNHKNYKLINVTNLNRKQLINYYQKATALLTSSFYESFNLPVLEALALGCPVIATSSAIIPELKKYVNIAKDEDEFLKLMFEIPKKPNKKIIKEIKEKFSWENYVKKLIKLYR